MTARRIAMAHLGGLPMLHAAARDGGGWAGMTRVACSTGAGGS